MKFIKYLDEIKSNKIIILISHDQDVIKITDEILKLICDLKEIGTYQMYLMGGEPFLRKDILDIISAIKDANMTFSVSTNGTLFNEKILIALSKKLNPETDWVQVSLDGSCEETMAKFRGDNVFEKVIKGISDLTKYGITVRVNTVITNNNIDEMVKIFDLCRHLKVARISFNPLFLFSKDMDKNIIDLEKVLSKFEELLIHHRKFNDILIQQDPIYIPYKIPKLSEFFAENLDSLQRLNFRAGIYSCEIAANGDVYPCSFLHNEHFRASNIRDNSIDPIWKNDNNWLTMFDRNFEKSECNTCEHFEVCKGGCLAAAFSYHDTVDEKDPRCYT